MSLLAEAAALLGDPVPAAVLYGCSRPGRCSTRGPPRGSRGSVARYLGILATATGRWEEATRTSRTRSR